MARMLVADFGLGLQSDSEEVVALGFARVQCQSVDVCSKRRSSKTLRTTTTVSKIALGIDLLEACNMANRGYAEGEVRAIKIS